MSFLFEKRITYSRWFHLKSKMKERTNKLSRQIYNYDGGFLMEKRVLLNKTEVYQRTHRDTLLLPCWCSLCVLLLYIAIKGGVYVTASLMYVAMQPVKQKKTAVSLAETAVLCVKIRKNYSSSSVGSLAQLCQTFWTSSLSSSISSRRDILTMRSGSSIAVSVEGMYATSAEVNL